ncbi:MULTISPECIES: alanine--tRNA ligase [unclassified Gemella]|uniref:alanine--tRNA ligase n=1 Tax=unclassified Gemella TaxID=2624949 RepID=UPI00107341BC|nr:MULTISPECIES: alanine--tRNA ligase [unclassified Gemella]MBF0710621.1 alanine--tRNA ligase [Gemella sp. GL1.1]MBF0746400.1 alanine--tRNA ligase [Gemella sp. 19428wG2_WT2a]NYS27965.1 alanine--tRNA ligase [Gemella sp. GL1]TFU60183.1 alanine--tRNA ligase [Gemella sp. WT2a]
MKQLTSAQVRRMFLDFFKEKEHMVEPGASLVPNNDPSLLWINSGVAALKKYFDGREIPEKPRITNSQKSIRTNDIENVGKTARHHTFFEMLGNFSIGDYFKEEAVEWAWEFLTSEKWLGLDKDKMYVTIHPEDSEAYKIWTERVGLAPERITRIEGNFWDIGEGPSGPNTEIFYDRGPESDTESPDCEMYPGGENGRYLEVWNVVFSQYNHNPDGTYTELPAKNIDTGMGLERIVSVMQDVPTNFDTDLFIPIIRKIEEISGKKYLENEDCDVAFKVIADHIRTVVFAVSDGALPSNEGRGYILRRLIRRAIRFSKYLDLNSAFMYKLTPVVAEIMYDYYPEVTKSVEFVSDVILKEEERFHETLQEGELILNSIVEEVKNTTRVIPGEAAFKLYDTFGFPIELTEEYAEELGLKVDIDGFNVEMEKQKERARSSRQDDASMQVQSDLYSKIDGNSEFVGYTEYTTNSKLIAIINNEDEVVSSYSGDEVVKLIFDTTPFYAESGGQVADRGTITAEGFKARVFDVKKLPDKRHIHFVKVEEGILSVSNEYSLAIDLEYRLDLNKNHTATHLLNEVLRDVVGSHIKQAGSLVTDEKLRFDISHFTALTEEEIAEVEKQVNEKIWQELAIEIKEMPIDQARAMGAQALFGEKYGDVVRVVNIGDYSIELCGGTHVTNSSEIGIVKIVSESGVAAGVRRIEAITGKAVYQYLQKQETTLAEICKLTKAKEDTVVEKVKGLQEEVKKLTKEKESLQAKIANAEINSLLASVKEINGVKVLTSLVESDNMNHLKQIVDNAKDKLENYVIAFASLNEDKVNFVVAVDKTLTSTYQAGKLVNVLASTCDGKGGGRPDMAQAGAKDQSKIQEAFEKLEKEI